MLTVRRESVDTKTIEKVARSGGQEVTREGANQVVQLIRRGLELGPDKGGFSAEQVSLQGLAHAFGLIDHHDHSAFSMACEQFRGEASPGVGTALMKTVTKELIHTEVIAGYEDDSNFIGQNLVRVLPNQRLRSQKITGFKALGADDTVHEGHPYEETTFEDKYVTTSETKKGRIISLNEETILFDQTGQVVMRARELGFWIRQNLERTIVRGAIDADSNVYRPSGTTEALYATDGSNFNYIGSGNTTSTSFNAASALQDWSDLDHIRKYRATEVKDDRVDGTTRAIAGLNGPNNVMLVPEGLAGTADYVVNQTHTDQLSGNSANQPTTRRANPVSRLVGQVLSSPFVDEVNGDDYYYGDFQRQFVWTEIWPIQTFSQSAESEAGFERDTVMRFKVRYYGGISALDTIWVTKVDGA